MRSQALPFSPSHDFQATRPFTISGVDYSFGMPFPKDQVDERKLRQLHDNRMIQAVRPERIDGNKNPKTQAPVAAASTPAPVVGGGNPGVATAPAAAAPGVSFKKLNKGFGKWMVVDAKGAEVSGPHTKAGIDAALADALAKAA